eukprot:9721025-Lingulodinium_polyedra.AAC.1
MLLTSNNTRRGRDPARRRNRWHARAPGCAGALGCWRRLARWVGQQRTLAETPLLPPPPMAWEPQ